MSHPRHPRGAATDNAAHHRGWLSLIEISGPFLSLPVLRATWPAGLDPLDKPVRERLRGEHGVWADDPAAGQQVWIEFLLGDLLGWGDALHTAGLHTAELNNTGLDSLSVEVAEYDATLTPSFALVEPGEHLKPDTTRLLGLICEPGQRPTTRLPGSAWAATPVDRVAHLCRHHDIELGLVTDGRWWALVWAPRGGVTATAVFDTASWSEAADRDAVRGFVSLLSRRRFFGVADGERLVPLLRASLGSQEEITEALGVQVRKAVELLVAAIGRADLAARERRDDGLVDVDAHDVYRGAVSVMMRVVFLLFAEERGLLPADNELYARTYSAGRLGADLEQRALEGSELDLEHSSAAWHRLLALFDAVHTGIDHPRLHMPAHDGGLFDPEHYRWLPLSLDDRTVLHVLRAVQYVQVGKGRNAERRALSFRSLDVEQIGYVYEGLLSFEGFRADEVVVGLIGKEGHEDEAPLTALEKAAAAVTDLPALAAALADQYKASGIGSATALGKKLAPLAGVEREEARKKLLAATGGNYLLAERLLPFYGLLRTDLRDLPVVILPGALYVTESALRGNTGTHYTPRKLAEDVVLHALEPLVFAPGPLQTANRAQWTQVSSEQILALKVADIAMGSAAFLVAAARYLGARLVDAWVREGDPQVVDYAARCAQRGPDADDDPVMVEARRQVIEHCLYGVDINPMAVEMAKLSLWLVSMDPIRPFTFLDDRLVAGDSLLGITSLDQLEYLHMDPTRGRKLHEDIFGWIAGVRSLVAEIAAERTQIAGIQLGDDPLAALARKRGLLADAELRATQLRLFADLGVGAALAYAGHGERGLGAGSVAAAQLVNDVASGKGEPAARAQRKAWLATDQVDGSFDREPLHWPLVFPEVFERGGFDAIIGNPPFLGGKKLTGSLGSAYRDYLVEAIGRGVRGHADLIAYFALRVHGLLNEAGQAGLIATNTLAQGDTREVGLDQIVADGITIHRSVKSETWPSKSAALEYCAVWTSGVALSPTVDRRADGLAVAGITSSLDPVSRVIGNPERLSANAGLSFIGSYVLGMGFVMEPDQAGRLIEMNTENKSVLFPYLNGEDLNSRPDCSATRWVINLHDWTEERAKAYAEVFQIVVSQVRPERQRCKPDGTYVLRRPLPERYWQYADKRPAMTKAIAELKRVIVITLVSKTVMPVMVPTGQVFAHKLGIFATADTEMLAYLSSAPHYWWTISRTSTFGVGAAPNYSPSDANIQP